MRVFWSSGLVDRPSDRLYVRTIPLSGCMDRRSRYRQVNGGKYWNVARVARKWLAVPDTSTPSERMFSICSLVDTAKRLNILGVLIENQVFCCYNIPKFSLTSKI